MKLAAYLRRTPLLAFAASLSVVTVAQTANADGSTPSSASNSAPAPAPVAAATLSVTATTATSITLYWKSPADPSIVGYAMFVNGTRVAAVQNIHYAFSNLKCGTSYDLALDSYNQPQIHSAKTSLTASTSPCAGTVPTPPAPVDSPGAPHPKPGPAPAPVPAPVPVPPGKTPPPSSAGVFLAPGGSDANPCSLALPCQSFDRGYHLAQPGQVVHVGGGSYPLQQLSRDAAKVNASANVVFQATAGQLAVLGGVTLIDVHHVTFLGASTGDLSAPSAGLTLKSSPATMNTGADFNATFCSSSVLVKDMDMRQVGIDGSDNVTVDGGTVGGYDNSGGDSHVGGPYQGRGTANCTAENPFGILLTHIHFHDVQRTNLPSAHPDCLQFYGTAGTVVDGNWFVNCGTSNIMARPNPGLWSGDTIDSLVLQNNSFTPATEGGAVATLGTATDSCGSIAVLNNTSTAGLSAFACGSYKSLIVSGNVAFVPSYTCTMALQKPNVTFSGNSSCNSAGAAPGAPAHGAPPTPPAQPAPPAPPAATIPPGPVARQVSVSNARHVSRSLPATG